MPETDVELARRAWSAAQAGDIDELRALLDPEVRWYGADEPEGGCHDRDQAVAFLRQAQEDGVSVDVLEVHDAGTRVVAILRTRHPAGWGEQPGPHGEVVGCAPAGSSRWSCSRTSTARCERSRPRAADLPR